MTSELNLNENQANEIRTILTSSATVREAKMSEIKARKAEGTKLSKEERRNLMREMKEGQKNVSDKMKKILTAEQFAKWEKIQAEKKDKMQDKMKEMKEEKLN